MAKKLLSKFFYLVYLLAFILILNYFIFYSSFVADLRELKRPPGEGWQLSEIVPKDALSRVGALRIDTKNSFINFSPSKKTGVTRFCTLGDSFTFGDEVASGHDYPTLLKEKFIKEGAVDVEVINFASSWFGFGQAYLMWDIIGRSYSCDYLLLGPQSFQPKRDTTFNHTDLLFPYFLHSRYIVDGEDIRLIDVSGQTHSERFEGYFNFIPKWRYLRYDRNPPAILRSMVPEGRTLKNPFYYYRGAPEEEAAIIYKVLLSRIAESVTEVVLLHMKKDIIEIGRSVGRENLSAEMIPDITGFPYRAPKNHFSAWGNELIAEIFYSRIAKSDNEKISRIKTFDIKRKIIPPGTEPSIPLYTYDSIDITLGGEPAGFFVTSTTDHFGRGLGSPNALKSTAIYSLLAIGTDGLSLVDECFVPASKALREGAPVTLKVVSPSVGMRERTIGRVRLLDKQVNIGEMVFEGLHISGCETLSMKPAEGDSKESVYTVLVDGNKMLEGRRVGEVVVFNHADPYIDKMARISAVAPPGPFIGIGDLNNEGYINILLKLQGKTPITLPLARWKANELAM